MSKEATYKKSETTITVRFGRLMYWMSFLPAAYIFLRIFDTMRQSYNAAYKGLPYLDDLIVCVRSAMTGDSFDLIEKRYVLLAMLGCALACVLAGRILRWLIAGE